MVTLDKVYMQKMEKMQGLLQLIVQIMLFLTTNAIFSARWCQFSALGICKLCKNGHCFYKALRTKVFSSLLNRNILAAQFCASSLHLLDRNSTLSSRVPSRKKFLPVLQRTQNWKKRIFWKASAKPAKKFNFSGRREKPKLLWRTFGWKENFLCAIFMVVADSDCRKTAILQTVAFIWQKNCNGLEKVQAMAH